VRAQILMAGWDRFGSLGGWEERLRFVASTFASQANQFIQDTLVSRFSKPDEESIAVPFEKLVVFYLMLSRDEEAFQLSELLVRLLERDTAVLPLKPSRFAFANQ